MAEFSKLLSIPKQLLDTLLSANYCTYIMFVRYARYFGVFKL